MKKVKRVVKTYEQYVAINREIKDKALQTRMLFSGLRSFCRQMMDEGRVILSYEWFDMDDIDCRRPDPKWLEYRIWARLLYVGKRRVRDVSFRRFLRRGRNDANYIIYAVK